MLDQCRSTVADGGPTLIQHWVYRDATRITLSRVYAIRRSRFRMDGPTRTMLARH